MRRRFLLIGNQLAGRGRTGLADAVVEHLRKAGATVDRCAGATEADALAALTAAVRQEAFDAVIAAGGDGTVRLAAKAVVGMEMPLGFIPLGTGNVLAHEIDQPRDAAALALMLLEGEAHPVHTATANGELFLLMAGAGFDGRIIAGLDHHLKNRVGRLAYMAPTIAALRAPPDRLEVTADGTTMQATWAIAANACRYGGAFRLAPGTHVLRPGLLLVLFRGATTLARVRELMAVAAGNLEALARRSTQVEIQPASRIRIVCAAQVPCQLDGDAFGTTPLDIAANGPSVRLILPLEPQKIVRGV